MPEAEVREAQPGELCRFITSGGFEPEDGEVIRCGAPAVTALVIHPWKLNRSGQRDAFCAEHEETAAELAEFARAEFARAEA